MRPLPSPRTTTVVEGAHVITVECLDRLRWRVCIDGRLLARFSSESRAHIAGRAEVRRLDHVAGRGGPVTPR